MNADRNPPETNSPGKLPSGCTLLIVGVIAVFAVAVFTSLTLNPSRHTGVPYLRNPVPQTPVIRRSDAEPFNPVPVWMQVQVGGVTEADHGLTASDARGVTPRIPQQT